VRSQMRPRLLQHRTAKRLQQPRQFRRQPWRAKRQRAPQTPNRQRQERSPCVPTLQSSFRLLVRQAESQGNRTLTMPCGLSGLQIWLLRTLLLPDHGQPPGVQPQIQLRPCRCGRLQLVASRGGGAWSTIAQGQSCLRSAVLGVHLLRRAPTKMSRSRRRSPVKICCSCGDRQPMVCHNPRN